MGVKEWQDLSLRASRCVRLFCAVVASPPMLPNDVARYTSEERCHIASLGQQHSIYDHYVPTATGSVRTMCSNVDWLLHDPEREETWGPLLCDACHLPLCITTFPFCTTTLPSAQACDVLNVLHVAHSIPVHSLNNLLILSHTLIQPILKHSPIHQPSADSILCWSLLQR